MHCIHEQHWGRNYHSRSHGHQQGPVPGRVPDLGDNFGPLEAAWWGGATREKMQKHHYPENYLTEEDWSAIQSDNMTFSSKASVIIRRLRLIGLNTPSEKTYVHIVALMYCANKAHYGVNVNPVSAFATVRGVKVLFKSWNCRVGSFMYDFPMSPDDLKKVSAAVFESAYKEGPPVASRVDPAAMKLLTDNIPARKSRATVTTPVTMPVRSSVGMGHQEESLHHMLGQMLLNRCIDPNRCSEPIPGLTVFDAPKKQVAPSRRRLRLKTRS